MYSHDLEKWFNCTWDSKAPMRPSVFDLSISIKTQTRHERVCGMETISSMPIPWIPSHAALCWMRIWRVKRASERGIGSMATVQNFKLCACPLEPLYPHSVIQRKEIELRVQRWISSLHAADSLITDFNVITLILEAWNKDLGWYSDSAD